MVDNYFDEYVTEGVILDGIATILMARGWLNWGIHDRVAFSNTLTKPEVVKVVLTGPASEQIVNIPLDLADLGFTIYSPDTINVQYTEEVTTSRKLTFNGTANNVVEGSTFTAFVFYSPIKANSIVEFHVARHRRLVSAGCGYGIAQYVKIEVPASELPSMPYAIYDTGTSIYREVWGTSLIPSSQSAFDWAIQKANSLYQADSIYCYMFVPTLQENEQYNGGAYTYYAKDLVGWDDVTKLKNCALDREVQTAFWELDQGTAILSYEITNRVDSWYTSPISQLQLRIPQLTQYKQVFNLLIPITNHWPDSKVRIRGNADYLSAAITLSCDTAPEWRNNSAPLSFLYMGLSDQLPADTTNITEWDNRVTLMTSSAYRGDEVDIEGAMGGAAVHDFNNSAFVYDPDVLLPLLKAYPNSPSNGTTSVMVLKTRQGSRYQKHYLSLEVSPNAMPPDRASDANPSHRYPRAWQSHNNSEYNYQMNPSVYTEKVEASEIYIMHPEDGMLSKLRNVIGMNPISLGEGDVLEYREPCSVVAVDYAYFLVEGVSPLTQSPASPYRPIGIGIRKT